MTSEGDQKRVLFVCLGNICRSPTAHGVFEEMVSRSGLSQSIAVDSAGTGAWHIGDSPDERASAAAAERGYDLSSLRARQVHTDDYLQFDYILAMDTKNLSHLSELAPENYQGHIGLFLDFHPQRPMRDVPDPYYGGDEGFDEVLDLIEAASRGLLHHVRGD